MPQSFVGRWDRWMQETLAGARDLLGERWNNTYFTAPIWRFALAPGVCGEHSWAGVLMPSVDQVGRTFPLTLAARLSNVQQLAAALFDHTHWFAQLEEAALAALSADADIRALDQALIDVPFPDRDRALASYTDATTATQALAQSHERPLYFADATDFARVMTVAATEAFIDAPVWHAYWWTWGRSESHAAALVLNGLPDARTFATMLSI